MKPAVKMREITVIVRLRRGALPAPQSARFPSITSSAHKQSESLDFENGFLLLKTRQASQYQ